MQTPHRAPPASPIKGVRPAPELLNRPSIRAVQIRVLGSVDVCADHGSLSLGAPKQRRVLGALISRAGETVCVDALVDAVWDGRPPRSAAKTLQGYVVHLRQALAGVTDEPPALIVTSHAGYRLQVPEDSIDALAFIEMLGRA